jgi:Glycosyl hydrolases family 6
VPIERPNCNGLLRKPEQIARFWPPPRLTAHRRRLAVAVLGILVSIGATTRAATAAGHAVRAHAAYAQQCADPFSATRDPANPLGLARAPGADPLRGGSYFVDGPRHGNAAGAIARLVGIDPTTYPDNYSWARFSRSLNHGALHRELQANPGLAYQVAMLSKIAAAPEEQRFSLYSMGGGPGAIFGQVQKIFCHNMTADPGSIPIVTTFFLYQAGYCESRAQILANQPTFDRQIDEMAAGIERRPAVMLLEIDGVATSKCAGPGGLGPWEADLRYEISRISALPHTVVYVEGGYADANNPRYTAKVLNAIGVRKIRGFFTNDGHNDWTTHEIRWGEQVSKLTHGAHFIVNTASNGRGPKLNPHPTTQGVEDLCNPPRRGIGPPETTHTGFKRVDAFLWTGVPGNSSGPCRGGPDPGDFWVARAISLAAAAQDKLGPKWPNHPY